jgi:hypothetical protein
LEGCEASVPKTSNDKWPGESIVRTGAGRTLNWNQLLAIVDATHGRRISPGIIQTLISTAKYDIIPWINANAPGIYDALGIPAPPPNAADFLNDWLLHGAHSILAGAAYIRMHYNNQATRFDIPLAGAAYNHGKLQKVPQSLWGLRYHDEYVERAGPHFNAAINKFNANPGPDPVPSVRFMR